MSESSSKVPVKKSEQSEERSSVLQTWRPMDSLRREIDRLFDDFDRSFDFRPLRRSMFDIQPFGRRERLVTAVPAVDISETDRAYEITAELPGLDEKDIEVKLVNGNLKIKGEKREEKEEKRQDYYLHERRFGAFERVFPVPEGVDAEKIEATFKKGVLALKLPKKPEVQKPEKKITVKGA